MKATASLITAILTLLPFSGSSAASLPGCHPTWQRDTSYLPSSLVSLSTLVNATLRTYKTFNYQCKEDPLNRFCGQVGFQPGLDGIDGAWTLVWQNVGECEGNVALSPPTAAPTRSRWSGVGCPDPFKMDVSYAEGDRVQVNGEVYQCKPFPYSGYCGQSGFEPGTGTAWNDAWTLLGSCQGTISPTSSPNYDLPVFGGCPEEYSESAVYEDGDKVSLNGLVFKCRAFPYSVWCSHDSYAPSTENWKDAWEVLGTCQGSMSPTASPVFDVLVDVDGCPEKYVEGKGYEAGDRVTLFVEDGRGIVYRCSDQWPESGYCGLIPPGHASKLGWTLQGSCSGTIAPSSSPFFVSLPDTSGCPEKYSASTQYESGDRVSVYVDSERAVVWECKQYPNGPYCNQYPPNDDSLLGWSKVGSCTGTMSPTSSPIFVNLAEVGDGCPKTFDVATRYETGDLATVDSSNIPSRKLVYECKSPYCNAGPYFAPGSANSDLGWVLKGYCGGTIAPTSSPVAWSGTCQYNNGTALLDVHPWSLKDLSSYKAGTRVRKGSHMYQCKSYPYYLWCRMSAYEPRVGASWRDAWINAGTCQ